MLCLPLVTRLFMIAVVFLNECIRRLWSMRPVRIRLRFDPRAVDLLEEWREYAPSLTQLVCSAD